MGNFFAGLGALLTPGFRIKEAIALPFFFSSEY
jgi:hypothetical protein